MKIFPLAIFAAAASLLAGCATWTFTPERTSRFVNDSGQYAIVDYGRLDSARESVFTTPTGVRLPFKSKLKVRVETPSGDRFVAYQRMSTVGMLYISDDERWEYFERGTGCLIARSVNLRGGGEPKGALYVPVFQGIFANQVRSGDSSSSRGSSSFSSSTPHGFKAPSAGPGESMGPPPSTRISQGE